MKDNTSNLNKLEQNFRKLITERCNFCYFNKYLAENPNFEFPKITMELLGWRNSKHIIIPGLFGGFDYFLEDVNGKPILYAEQSSRMDYSSDSYLQFEITESGSRMIEGEERAAVRKKFREATRNDSVERLRQETITRLEKMEWEDAVRIVKRFVDPVDVRAAYEWSEHIGDGLLEASYIQAILD